MVRDDQKIDLETKETRTLKRHDVLSFNLSGAGGYGEPGERETWRIEDDILDGYVTEEGAERDYGVRVEGGKVAP